MNFFDLHCDTATECFRLQNSFFREGNAVSAVHSKLFEVWKQCFAVWINDEQPKPYSYYRSVIANFKNELNNCPYNLYPIFTVEGGALLENDISRLSEIANDGVRAIALTWNGKNQIASGSNEAGGLTAFGKEVISKMNRLGIACDLSHLNRESFWNIIELAEHPLATHSCCCAVYEHKRNLDDSQLIAIAKREGIIGLCFYPPFLGCGDVYDGIFKNISHMIKLGLENHIAIGSDFDGGKMSSKLDSTKKIPDLRCYLSHCGISDELLEKIFYLNAEKFFI